LIAYLSELLAQLRLFFAPDPSVVRGALQPGDVLPFEGNSRISAIIKSWSHATLYLGERPGDLAPGGAPNVLLEAEAGLGVVALPLFVADYALARLGKQQDAERIIDLTRYLFPYPPVPVWFRLRMLAIGSGDPTKTICSTPIAAAFEPIHYTILPEIVSIDR